MGLDLRTYPGATQKIPVAQSPPHKDKTTQLCQMEHTIPHRGHRNRTSFHTKRSSCSSHFGTQNPFEQPASPYGEQLYIACITVRQLDGLVAGADGSLSLGTGQHEVDQRPTMGSNGVGLLGGGFSARSA